MRNLDTFELTFINGGLNCDGISVTVSSQGIPDSIFNIIEFALQKGFDREWEFGYAMAYITANGCMPYYQTTYKENLWAALY